MTKEEFDKLEDKWQTVYIDGKTPIRMVSKRSSKEDHILWYDEDECSHTIHYSQITLEQSDFEKELDKLAKKEVNKRLKTGNLMVYNTPRGVFTCPDLTDLYKAGYYEALKRFNK